MKARIFAAALLVACCSAVLTVEAGPFRRGGCSGGSRGSCSPSPPDAAQPSPAAAWEWKAFDDDDVLALMCNGRQVGGYRFSCRTYRPYANGRWGEGQATAPIALPVWGKERVAKAHAAEKPKKGCCCDCGCYASGRCVCREHKEEDSVQQTEEQEPMPNYGIDRDKMREAPTQNKLNGFDVSKRALIEAIMASVDVPADAESLCLTVIGTDAERKRVLDDLRASPLLTPFKDKIRVQDYGPGEWPLAAGFVADGSPTIYLQFPDGRVPVRLRSYKGPEQIARALATALRRRAPDYDPATDPDLPEELKPRPKPDPKPSPEPSPGPAEPKAPDSVDNNTTMHAGCIFGGFAMLALLAHKRRSAG